MKGFTLTQVPALDGVGVEGQQEIVRGLPQLLHRHGGRAPHHALGVEKTYLVVFNNN